MNVGVALFRVSSRGQEKSGLGLEAQQYAVNQYKTLTNTEIRKEYFEVMSGKEFHRPVLKKAIRFCRRHNAVLIIAKLDRLARNVALVLYLLDSKIKFVDANKPFANRWDILRQAVNDEEEGYRISERTKLALQAAKRRGVKLGKNGKKLAKINRRNAEAFAKKTFPLIREIQTEGITSVRKIASELNKRKIPPYRKGARWHKTSVHNLLNRVKKMNLHL